MKKQASWVWLVVGLVVIAALVAGLWLNKKADEGSADEDGDQPQASDEDQAPAMNFDYIYEQDWPHLDRATRAIQALTPEQTILFGVVQDPTDPAHVYFSSYAPDPADEEKFLLSVYNYNTETFEFERIFRRSYGPGFPGLGDGKVPNFHVVGYDNGKLIILARAVEAGGGPCTVPLTEGREKDDEKSEMLAMNLESPYDLMVPYSIPDEVYNAALEEQQKCSV